MSILLLDLGNRRLKWAVWAQQNFLAGGAADWREHTCCQLLARHVRQRPRRILACNVAGAAQETELTHYCREHWGLDIEYLRAAAACAGVRNAYAEPARLGADRWAALLGAHALYPATALAVVDCGTAVTLDLLTAEGRHLGGAIMPGLLTMRESLARHAHQLAVTGGLPKMPAINTQDALASGTLYALVGGIERLLSEAAKSLVETPRVIVTGGDAELVQQYLSTTAELQLQLVFIGLLAAYRELQ